MAPATVRLNCRVRFSSRLLFCKGQLVVMQVFSHQTQWISTNGNLKVIQLLLCMLSNMEGDQIAVHMCAFRLCLFHLFLCRQGSSNKISVTLNLLPPSIFYYSFFTLDDLKSISENAEYGGSTVASWEIKIHRITEVILPLTIKYVKQFGSRV